jgi:hypothetical protein
MDEAWQVSRQREFGTILQGVWAGKDYDHDMHKVVVPVGFGGDEQAFTDLFLNSDEMSLFVNGICDTFRVSKLEDLVGRNCFGLRCWGFHNDHLEGLEGAESRQRFVISDFYRKVLPHRKCATPIERRREYLQSRIECARQDLMRAEDDLEKVRACYVEWHSVP